MMEAAGAAASAFIIRTIKPRPTVILCGPGNNGGDGFVVARTLKDAGWPVRVGAVVDKTALTGDARLMADLFDGPVEKLAPSLLVGAGLIVDALFGIGLARDLDGDIRALVEAINAGPAPVIALDIPSGVDADTGRIRGAAIRASATITFIAKKPGHVLFPGRAFAGAVQLADIGVKDEWVRALSLRTFENHPGLWGSTFRRPSFESHKFTRGHAAVVSGPRLRTGAARLGARAALRAGAGLVTMLSPTDACDENAAQLTAVQLREAGEAASIAEALADERFTAALIGPAAGVGAATRDKTAAILKSGAAAVLDADALTSFAEEPAKLFAMLRPGDVLTPHVGEFARLFPELKDAPRLEAARAASVRAKCIIVLKGADTIIASPDGAAVINTTAPFDLATAGSGDVLAGIIAGLLAQGMPGAPAAAAGVWLHGAAGQIAGPGLIAEDLPDILPRVLRQLLTPPKAEPASDADERG